MLQYFTISVFSNVTYIHNTANKFLLVHVEGVRGFQRVHHVRTNGRVNSMFKPLIIRVMKAIGLFSIVHTHSSPLNLVTPFLIFSS